VIAFTTLHMCRMWLTQVSFRW